MAADTIGVPLDKVHVVSCQDTAVTPYGTGAYASRQTYAAGMAIRGCAEKFRQKILENAFPYTRMQPYLMDIADGNIIRNTDGRKLMSLGEFATMKLYDRENNEHITCEKSTQLKTNAYSFGCGFAEVEVDTQLCRVKVLKLVNDLSAEAEDNDSKSVLGAGHLRLLFDSSKLLKLMNLDCIYRNKRYVFSLEYEGGKCRAVRFNAGDDGALNNQIEKLKKLFLASDMTGMEFSYHPVSDIEGNAGSLENFYTFGGVV